MSREEDREKFLLSIGWDVEERNCEQIEIVIPKEFGNVFAEYNRFQIDNGYDLSKYAGKKCVQYIYSVDSQQGKDETYKIVLYVHGRKLIGGDIHSSSIDGAMYPLKPIT